MRLEQLEYFVEVIRSKSINKAAKKLFISQPSLSVSINTFEEELGYQLLKRSARGVIPTIQGEQIYQDANMILNTINSWYNTDNKQFVGDVPILATPSVCNSMMNQIVMTIKNTYPLINVILHEEKVQTILSRLLSEPINIGISSYIPDEEEATKATINKNGWQIDLLCTDEFQVLVSTQNPLSKKSALSFDDLKNCILAFTSDPTDKRSLPYFSPLFRADYCLRLGSKESIFQVVADNKAVAVFPAFLTRGEHYCKANLIRAIKIEGFSFPVNYYITYPNEKALSEAEKTVIEIIKQNFRDLDTLLK